MVVKLHCNRFPCNMYSGVTICRKVMNTNQMFPAINILMDYKTSEVFGGLKCSMS